MTDSDEPKPKLSNIPSKLPDIPEDYIYEATTTSLSESALSDPGFYMCDLLPGGVPGRRYRVYKCIRFPECKALVQENSTKCGLGHEQGFRR
jgi:hypothetical protein